MCVPENGRLRIRIETPGYAPGANCQFPRGLREGWARFSVPAGAVRLVVKTGGKKAFYRVDASHAVLLEGNKPVKVFDCTTDGMCSVCLSDPRTQVAVPCGHYFLCTHCARRMQGRPCAICRVDVSQYMSRDSID